MDWRFSVFLLTMFGLLLGFSWGTSEGGLCSAPYITKMLADPSKDGALNCFEFWFNRYQTFAAAVVAFLTAVVAVRPALAQLKEMQKQTDQNTFATLRARHFEISRAREFFFQITAKIEAANRCSGALIDAHPDYGISQEKVDAFRNSEELLGSHLATLEQSIEPIWIDVESLTSRKRLIDVIYAFGTTAGEIRSRLDSVKFRPLAGTGYKHAVEASRGDIVLNDSRRDEIFGLGQTYFDLLNQEENRINRTMSRVQPRAFS